MADAVNTGRAGASAQGKSIGTMANLAGAAISLALVAGVGVWGYKLLVRDVSGVPVVLAAEGPMRLQPENPGGHQADHQGLSVNSVAAQGAAADPADRLVLAPQPVSLSDEDAPQTELGLATPAPARQAPVAVAAPSRSDTTNVGRTPETVASASSVDDLVNQLTAGAAPLAAPTPRVSAPVPAPIETAAVAPVVAPANQIVGGLKRSLRPQLRPARLAAIQPVSAPANTGATTTDIDAASIPAGTRLVQLGAYDSEKIAKQEWSRLSAQFADYLPGKSRVIQKAKSGGRSFYRLRAMGFDDLSDARRFCAVLVAEKADCIPVVTR